MKKIYKIGTNERSIFATYDFDDKITRILDNYDTNSGSVDIRGIKDDSSWEMIKGVGIADVIFWLIEYYFYPDMGRIIDETDFE